MVREKSNDDIKSKIDEIIIADISVVLLSVCCFFLIEQREFIG
jgi:hypothetical protein